MADENKPCRRLITFGLTLLLPLAVFAEDGLWETVCEENGVLRDAGEIPPLLGKLMKIDPRKGETALFFLRVAGKVEPFPLDERERKITKILQEEGVEAVFLEGEGRIWPAGGGRILAETFSLQGFVLRGGKKIPWRVSFAKGRRWPFFF